MSVEDLISELKKMPLHYEVELVGCDYECDPMQPIERAVLDAQTKKALLILNESKEQL